MPREIVSVDKCERKILVQLGCGHWIKYEGQQEPRIGQTVFCSKCQQSHAG